MINEKMYDLGIELLDDGHNNLALMPEYWNAVK